MSPEAVESLGVVVTKVLSIALQDEEVKSHLKRLLHSFAFESQLQAEVDTDPVGLREQAKNENVQAGADGDAASPPVVESIYPAPVKLVKPFFPRTPRPVSAPENDDLPRIAERCRLKGEASKWTAERSRLKAAGADHVVEIAPFDQAILSRGKDQSCFLWMSNRGFEVPADLQRLDELGHCFDVLADALELVNTILPDGTKQDVADVLQCLASASSALRNAVAEVSDVDDDDQKQVFLWLKRATSERAILVKRHMRFDDPADPSSHADIKANIVNLRLRHDAKRKWDKERSKGLKKLKYVANSILSKEDGEQHLDALVTTVDQLVAGGVPPSNIEIREELLPIVGRIKALEQVPKNVELVLREIRKAQESRTVTVFEGETEQNHEVAEVATLLEDRSVVVLGTLSANAKDALKSAFRLRDVFVPCAKESASYKRSESYIARSEVALVLILIARTAHEHHEAKRFADQHGKPFIYVQAGVNPNKVAHDILSQCGERLRKSWNKGEDA